MRTLNAFLAYAVQGSGGAIPATWNVGTLTATAGITAATTITATGKVSGAAGATGNELINVNQLAVTLGSPWKFHLPGGITIQGSFSTGSVAGQVGVTFGTAFSGNPFGIFLQAFATALGGGGATIANGSVTSTGFNATIFDTASATPIANTFYWLAVGPT